MRKPSRLIRYTRSRGLKPLPKTSVSVWADAYRQLSAGISAEPGKWRTDRAPYQREIMDAFTQSGIHRVVVMSSSQIGKSDIMNNVIGRFAHLDPCTIMMVQPTIDMAEDFSKSRIAPMLRDTKVLTNLFFDVKTRDSNNTILSKIFPGGRLIMCGANSPAGLASRPVRVLLCDEVDRFPLSAGTEGDPVELASKRMTTFWNRVSGLFSTPTVEGSSRIAEEYFNGTQEEWQHECPNCKTYHLLRYIDMKVDMEELRNDNGTKSVIVRSVVWRCPDCGSMFSESEMRKARQRYVPQNQKALHNGVRSFFVNCFTSPWLTWGEVMKEWLDAKGDPAQEQVVMNTRFGEPYRQPGEFADEQIFLRRREMYPADLPDGVLLLTASVDVQGNRLEYEICGWGMAEESWGIRKGIILGKPNQPKTWEMLDDVIDRTYSFTDGTGLKVTRTFIDSGGLSTAQVYEYCRTNAAKQRFAIKGQGGPGIPLLHKIGRAKVSGIALVMLGVDDGKQQIMNRLAIEEPGPQYFHFPKNDDAGYDDLYFKGIISEHKKQVIRGGQIKEIWETTTGIRNEPLDLRVYNLACMKSLNIDWKKQFSLLHPEGVRADEPIRKAPVREAEKPKSRQVNIW